jgi:hypothetical protein
MGITHFEKKVLTANLVNKICDICHKNIPLDSYPKEVSNEITVVIHISYILLKFSVE